MNRMVHHPIARCLIWWLTVCVITLAMPPLAVWAQPAAKPRITHKAPKRTTDHGPRTTDPIRVLTAAEMEALRGAGQYRNPGLAGTRPWQRSFRDVNLCTGNLMKSFTDIQVAGTRGPGLAWQRTYNSQIEKAGPFGTGWQTAYDIRIEESDGISVPQTGFLGTQHTYTRDADGLYSPPVYSTMRMESEYVVKFLETGDASMLPDSDTQTSEDGTTMHYVSEGTLANGDPRATRVCDYIEDRFGNRTTLTYDLTITPADGGTKKLLTRVTDPVGRYLQVTWVNRGTPEAPIMRVSQVEGPFDGATPVYTVSYEYNAEHNLWKVHQDPNGLNRTTTFEYTTCEGESGLLSRITDAGGRYVEYTYSIWPWPHVNVAGVRSVSEPGVTGNRITWAIEPADYLDYWNGAPVEVLAPSGLHWFVRLSKDQYLRAQFIDGHTVHDPEHECIMNLGWSWTYDQDYNVTGESICSNQFGEEQQVGRSVRMTYDLSGRLLTQENLAAPGVLTEYEYWGKEKNWQKKRQTDPALPDGRRPVTEWDYATDTDPNPGKRCQLVSVTDPELGTFTYDYNQYGQKISETNANTVTTTYTYSANYWENLTQVVQDPGGLARTTSMTYDIAGRVLTSTDPKTQTATFTYNALSQPLTASFPNETITYTYAADGQPLTVTDNRGTTVISYEADTGRVASVTDPVTGTVSYEYNLAGQKSAMTLPGNARTEFAATHMILDVNKQEISFNSPVDRVTDDQSREVDYLWYGLGMPTRVISNKGYQGGALVQYLQTRYYYDKVGGSNLTHGRLMRIENTWHRFEQGEGMGQWQSRVLSQNDYTYSNLGQRLTNLITDDQGVQRTEQYTYDRLSRLTGVDYGDGEVQSYTFDPMGNRLTKTVNGTPEGYTYNNANMLLTRGAASYTNDANGNTLSDGAANRSMAWDAQNRMASCTYNGTTSTFTYGADGLRRRMVTDANTTDYLLDGQSVVREIKNGVVNATYLNGPRGPEYKRDQNGAVQWYLYDGLGSVVGLVDSSGTVTNTRKYDVYGAPRNAQTGSAHCFVGGLGHTSDAETGLIYMRARCMDPATGRFVSEDPAQDGSNWYAYCGSNPIGGADPEGRAYEWDVVKALLQLYKESTSEAAGTFIAIGIWLNAVGRYATAKARWHLTSQEAAEIREAEAQAQGNLRRVEMARDQQLWHGAQAGKWEGIAVGAYSAGLFAIALGIELWEY